MKKLAIILLTTLVIQNVNAALSVSKTIAIHAARPTTVTATCSIQPIYIAGSIYQYYCDIGLDNAAFSYFTYSYRYEGSSNWFEARNDEYASIYFCSFTRKEQIPNGLRLYFAGSTQDGGGASGDSGVGYLDCFYGNTVTFHY